MQDTPKVVIVTGASRGLGRAIAIGFATQGYAVVLAARDAQALAAVAAEALAAGAPAALPIAGDLSIAGEPARVVAEAMARFDRLDVLVNNAGATKRGDFLDLTDEDHLAGFALKYHATVRFCRAAWPHLAVRGGAIVNISGVAGNTPDAAFTIGGPVNSAVINFTKALSKRAMAEETGIRVNALCPGHIVTDRLHTRIGVYAEQHGCSYDEAKETMRLGHGINRYGEPEDIANAVVFLASDKASYIQGAIIDIDGGVTPGI